MADLISLNAVLRKWQEEGVGLLPPVDDTYAIATLDSIGRQSSRDVVNLYCATGGMKDDDFRFWSLWSLDRVVTENLRYDRPYILFADFLINSHFYCFKYESSERSSVCIEYFNGEEPERIADSINDFFDLYLRSPEKLGMFDSSS
jgi:hypothetical protein